MAQKFLAMSTPRTLNDLLSSGRAAAVPLPSIGADVIRSRLRVSLQQICDEFRKDLNDEREQR